MVKQKRNNSFFKKNPTTMQLKINKFDCYNSLSEIEFNRREFNPVILKHKLT